MVKYSGTSIQIATLEGPTKVPIKISGVNIKPELIQSAGTILKILDWLQYTGCQRINQLLKIKDIPKDIISNLIIKQDEDSRMIAYFAMLSMMASSSPERFEKVIADWIASALPKTKTRDSEYKTSYEPLKKDYEEERISRREKISKTKSDVQQIDEEITFLENQYRDIRSQLKKLRERRDKLNDEVNDMMIMESLDDITYRIVTPQLSTMEYELESNLSKALEIFPYLSEAISKNEPFDIRKSINYLTENS